MKIRNGFINVINLCLNAKEVLPQTEKADMGEMLAISQKHALTNIVYLGLKKDKRYSEQDLLALSDYAQVYAFQYLRQEQELLRLKSALEEKRIRFVLLKGSRMREFYPSPEMRSCCDIDILTDASDETILETMQSLGYTYQKDGGTTLNFELPPMVTVEMHRFLFDEKLAFHGYFDCIWDRVIPAENGSSECFLTEEDFYVYMIAHLVKHFTRYGCGLRPLIDIYVYEREVGKRCNFAIAERTLEELDLLHFTKRMRGLLSKWFESGDLSEEDEILTDYLLNSGIFGTKKITLANKYRQSSMHGLKLRVLLSHFFPPLRIMRPMFPNLLRCPVFLPVSWIARLFRILFTYRKKAEKTREIMRNADKEYISQVSDIMKELHLPLEREEK